LRGVQSGCGATDEGVAAGHFSAAPDGIAIGKGMADGMPLSAYGAAAEVIDGWPVGAHGTTFGGNPVSCAAATAVLDTMGDLLPHARELSKRAFGRLSELQEKHPTIGDVRGLGLMIEIGRASCRERGEMWGAVET